MNITIVGVGHGGCAAAAYYSIGDIESPFKDRSNA